MLKLCLKWPKEKIWLGASTVLKYHPHSCRYFQSKAEIFSLASSLNSFSLLAFRVSCSHGVHIEISEPNTAVSLERRRNHTWSCKVEQKYHTSCYLSVNYLSNGTWEATITWVLAPKKATMSKLSTKEGTVASIWFLRGHFSAHFVFQEETLVFWC